MSNPDEKEQMILRLAQCLLAVKSLFSKPCKVMLTVRFPEDPSSGEFTVGDEEMADAIAVLQRRIAAPDDAPNAPGTETMQ